MLVLEPPLEVEEGSEDVSAPEADVSVLSKLVFDDETVVRVLEERETARVVLVRGTVYVVLERETVCVVLERETVGVKLERETTGGMRGEVSGSLPAAFASTGSNEPPYT